MDIRELTEVMTEDKILVCNYTFFLPAEEGVQVLEAEELKSLISDGWNIKDKEIVHRAVDDSTGSIHVIILFHLIRFSDDWEEDKEVDLPGEELEDEMSIDDACQQLFKQLHSLYEGAFSLGLSQGLPDGDEIRLMLYEEESFYQNPRISDFDWYKNGQYCGFKLVVKKNVGRCVPVYSVRGP